jgi:hypothetical protein
MQVQQVLKGVTVVRVDRNPLRFPVPRVRRVQGNGEAALETKLDGPIILRTEESRRDPWDGNNNARPASGRGCFG